MEGGFSTNQAPRSQANLNKRELESSVRSLVERYQGEELVKEVTIFIMLTFFEIDFQNDPNPQSLYSLGSERTSKAASVAQVLED